MPTRRSLSLLLVTLAFGFLALSLQKVVAGAAELPIQSVDWLWLGISLAGVLGLILCMAEIWRRMVRLMGGGSLSLGLGLHLHLIGWIGRYIPGKVAGMVGKVLLAESRGFALVPLGAATTYEQLYFFVVGAALAGSLLLPLPPGFRLLLVPTMLTAVAVLAWWLLPRLSPLLRRLQRNAVTLPKLTMASHFGLTLAYTLPHLAVGLGFWLLLKGLAIPGIGPLKAIAILTAAHVAGMLVFFAPAGVGAREAALTALLAPLLGLDKALAVAGLTRLWATAGDALAALYSGIYVVVDRLALRARRLQGEK